MREGWGGGRSFVIDRSYLKEQAIEGLRTFVAPLVYLVRAVLDGGSAFMGDGGSGF